MLWPKLIMETVMYVNFVESVAIRQWTACYIYRNMWSLHTIAIWIIRCFIISCENYTMSCICYCAIYLLKKSMVNLKTFYWCIWIIRHTLCLSICKGLKLGSNNNRCGSKLTGDCLLPLLHSDHSGFIKPQNAGPEIKQKKIH